MRPSGKSLIFIDLIADAVKIQIFVNRAKYGNDEEFNKLKQIIKRGDIIGAKADIGRSKTGELSVAATNM